MRQVINQLVYDTDAAQKIAENNDPIQGYEGGSMPYLQILYRTENGRFFVYHEYTGRFQKWMLGEQRHWIHPVDEDKASEMLCKWGMSPTLAGFSAPQQA